MKAIKILLFFSLPVVVCLGFGSLFYFSRDEFSLVDVNRPKNLDLFLNKFFSKVCTDAWLPETYYIEPIRRGCSYHYVFPALVNGFDIMLFPNNSASTTRFSFDSYSNRILKIKYDIGPLFPKPFAIDENQEMGVMSLDLSRFDNPGDDILVQFVPYIPFEGYLIKAIEEQPSIPDDFSKMRSPGWGHVLVHRQLSLGNPQKGNSSTTIGREQSYFVTTSLKSAYLDLRDYFESGSMKHFGLWDFIYFSSAILTSSALGDMAPTSLGMKIAVSIESLLGIMWLGIAAGWAFEYMKDGSKKP